MLCLYGPSIKNAANIQVIISNTVFEIIISNDIAISHGTQSSYILWIKINYTYNDFLENSCDSRWPRKHYITNFVSHRHYVDKITV